MTSHLAFLFDTHALIILLPELASWKARVWGKSKLRNTVIMPSLLNAWHFHTWTFCIFLNACYINSSLSQSQQSICEYVCYFHMPGVYQLSSETAAFAHGWSNAMHGCMQRAMVTKQCAHTNTLWLVSIHLQPYWYKGKLQKRIIEQLINHWHIMCEQLCPFNLFPMYKLNWCLDTTPEQTWTLEEASGTRLEDSRAYNVLYITFLSFCSSEHKP